MSKVPVQPTFEGEIIFVPKAAPHRAIVRDKDGFLYLAETGQGFIKLLTAPISPASVFDVALRRVAGKRALGSVSGGENEMAVTVVAFLLELGTFPTQGDKGGSE